MDPVPTQNTQLVHLQQHHRIFLFQSSPIKALIFNSCSTSSKMRLIFSCKDDATCGTELGLRSV
ncbi:hypothetical protein R6Q59_019006 [Mikania micrantha]